MTETKQKHTPGPWHNEKDAISASSRRYGQSTGVVFIARMEKHRLGSADHVCPEEIQDANARIIAAAPELLEALQLLQKAIHDLHLLDIKKRFDLCVADAAAGKAIAKALGGSRGEGSSRCE